MTVIVSKTKVQAALAHAEERGAADIEQACGMAAQALGIPVEAVREVAYELDGQDAA